MTRLIVTLLLCGWYNRSSPGIMPYYTLTPQDIIFRSSPYIRESPKGIIITWRESHNEESPSPLILLAFKFDVLLVCLLIQKEHETMMCLTYPMIWKKLLSECCQTIIINQQKIYRDLTRSSLTLYACELFSDYVFIPVPIFQPHELASK